MIAQGAIILSFGFSREQVLVCGNFAHRISRFDSFKPNPLRFKLAPGTNHFALERVSLPEQLTCNFEVASTGTSPQPEAVTRRTYEIAKNDCSIATEVSRRRTTLHLD
jgi:hypothetical protein